MCNVNENDIVKEIVTQTAGKAYDDIAHPTAHALGQLISFLPRTVKVWFGKWEKWILNGEFEIEQTKILLANRLKQTSVEKITEPEPYVAVPALQQLSYSLNSEELRQLYANLLASAMNIDTKEYVHPSFVDIIRQLLPDEARVLKLIYQNSEKHIVVENPNDDCPFPKLVHIADNSNEISTSTMIQDSPESYAFYLDNLQRLRLLKTQAVFSEDSYPKEFAKKYSEIELTEYGRLFCSICVIGEEI